MNRTSINYAWTHRKGDVLIVNNSFRHRNDYYRVGSEIDVRNLQELWKGFGCNVTTREDLNVTDMRRAIVEFVARCRGYDYCVVFIMSHGACAQNTDYVLGNEGGELSFDEIKEFFGNDCAHHLCGIPKLLFFQCCRTDPSTQNRCHPRTRCLSRVESDSKPAPESPLIHSDILVACATQQGSLAWRNSHHGSWFINAISNVFMQDAKEEHVADMMTKVNDAVALKATSVGSESVRVSMPVYEVMLRKKLYLYPGRTGAHE